MQGIIKKKKSVIITIFAVIAIISSVIFACGTTNKASAAEPETITEAYLKSLEYRSVKPYIASSKPDKELPLDRWIKIYMGQPGFKFTLKSKASDGVGETSKIINSLNLSNADSNIRVFEEEKTETVFTQYVKFPSSSFTSVIFNRMTELEFNDLGNLPFEPYIGYEMLPNDRTYQGVRLWYDFDSVELELKNDVWYKTKINSVVRFKYVSVSGQTQQEMDCTSYLDGTETFTDGEYQYVKFPSSIYYRVWLHRMDEENYDIYKGVLGYTPYIGYEVNLPTVAELKSLKYEPVTLYGEKESQKTLPVDSWIKMKIGSYIQFNYTSVYGKNYQFTNSEFPVDAIVKTSGDVQYVKFPSIYFAKVGFKQIDNASYQQIMTTIDYTPYIEYEVIEEEPEPPIESDSSSDVSGSESQSVSSESVNDSESNGKNLKGLIGVVSTVAGIIVISVAVYFVLAAFKPRRRRR